jgi:hypothetical protein
MTILRQYNSEIIIQLGGYIMSGHIKSLRFIEGMRFLTLFGMTGLILR